MLYFDDFQTCDCYLTDTSALCLLGKSKEEYAALAHLTSGKDAEEYMHFKCSIIHQMKVSAQNEVILTQM